MKAMTLLAMGLLMAVMGAVAAPAAERSATSESPVVAERPLGMLMLQTPPLQFEGEWYVPVREFCRWLRADITLPSNMGSLTVTWRGKSHTWTKESGGLAFHDGKGFVSIREFGEAFGEPVKVRQGEDVVDFGNPGSTTYTAIPVGWEKPTPPKGMTLAERGVWQRLVRSRLGVAGMVSEPADVRIAGRWASANLRPLNTVTDDALVLLEKRSGRWRVITLGTAVGADGRNYGIPAATRKKLGLPF
jgi:hypothetical protein